MFTNESLPLRSLGSSQAVKQRNRRYNGLGLATSQIPDLLVTSDETKPRKLPWYQINWTAYTQTGNPALVFWMSMTIAALVVFTEEATTAIVSFDGRILNGTSRSYNMKLLLQSHQSSYGRRRFELHPLPKKTSGKSDYGKLILHPRKNADEPIPIRSSSVDEFDQQRDKLLGAMDKSDDESYLPESSKEDEESKCRKVSWAAYSFPNCNQVHEHPITVFSGADFEVSYLNSGSYRSAYRFRRKSPPDHFVMKRMSTSRSFNMKDISKIQKEASILEQLSSSPRVLDIYGYCGASVLVEAMASDLHTKIIHGKGIDSQEMLDSLDNLYPRNNFTSSEKLQISIDMAESLADIHGIKGGPIIHADTHIEQWLIAPDGSVKLNDFNNAHLPLWNEKKGRYCLSHRKYGGTYRSPEEFSGGAQDESVDTFAFGNNIYTLMTGLWPFYDEEFREEAHDKTRSDIIKGKRPFVDPRYRTRSFIEGKLIEIMERCWAQRRQDRPSIFEVVSFLETVKIEATTRGELFASPLIKIELPAL